LLHYKVAPKQSHLSQIDSTVYLMEQLANLHQELHVQTTFSSLLHHLSRLLHLPLYSLEWLGFTLNHAVQRKRNVHVQVISSCCNLSVCTILQTKANTQLTSFLQVTSLQLNIYDECGQHSLTPQMSQQTVQSYPSRNSHLK
jgi:hypothetical protein